VIFGELIHGITELFAGDALEAVTLTVLVLVDACCCHNFPAFLSSKVLSLSLAIRANTAYLSPIAWKDLESCLI
jgi:hypothetical protein